MIFNLLFGGLGFKRRAAAGGVPSTVTIGNNTGNSGGVTEVTLKQGSPTTNQDGTAFEISKYGAGDYSHTVMRFDLSGIAGPVTVTAVSIFIYQTSNGGNYAAAARKLLVAFNETQATWNVKATASNWNTAGCQGNGTDRLAASTVGAVMDLTDGLFKEILGGAQLIADFQDQINTPANNFGFILERNDAGEDTNFKNFAAHTGTDGQRPYAVISYTTP